LSTRVFPGLFHCRNLEHKGGERERRYLNIVKFEYNFLEKKREVTIRCPREKEEDLFKEHLDGDSQFTDEVMKTVVSRGAMMSDTAGARIVIEGKQVLEDLNVPRACALLMGLIYALNLSSKRTDQKI
ncbi:hypothetical protein L3Q82_023815, partial [Scortum barcoo]